MAVYEILRIGNPVLREKSKPVKKITPNIVKLLNNMAETMRAADGVGFAAPQMGILKRVVIVDSDEGILELINPEILTAEGEEIDTEGCLSVPGITARVKRSYKVRVRALDRNSDFFELEAEGLLARAIQHEIDHLEGTLFVDRQE